MVWDGHTWVLDQDGTRMLELTGELVAWLFTLEDKVLAARAANRRRQIIAYAAGDPRIQATPDDFDQNRTLLTCPNGTYNLETNEFRESRPEDMLTSMCRVAYDSSAECPTWERFLEQALPDEAVRNFMQRWLGYCLTGSVEERKFVVCWGPAGNNGKSTLFNAMEAVLGDKYAWPAPPELLMVINSEQHPTMFASLCGKRLVVTSETRKGRTWDEEKVKRLTGNDAITARRMHENLWTFRPTHKLMIASNSKPQVKDISDSFWNRLILVPFLVSFTGDKMDLKLGEKLKAELPGILNWCIKGCMLWQKDGLQVPEKATLAAQTYREEEDWMGNVIDQCFVFEAGARLSRKDAMAKVEAWIKEHAPNLSINSKTLWERFRLRNLEEVKDRQGERGWVGVRPRTAADGNDGKLTASELPSKSATSSVN